jgi:hypothetical protein
MEAQERCDFLKSNSVRSFMEGKNRPPFPETVDNTLRSAFRKCERSCFNEHFLCRATGTDSIHLVAGGAYAAGHDAFRKSFFTKESGDYKNYERALDKGIVALIEHYGYDEQREASDGWKDSPKSCDRLVSAFLDYWTEYHPKLARGKMYYHLGEPASELGGVLELDVCHPTTGKPLLYSFRFDYVENRDGSIWLGDDKTTTSLGTSWARQWDMRAQFLGYTYAARKLLGIPAIGVIARGTGILKTTIKHMEVPVSFPEYLLELWWQQVNGDFAKMVAAWESNQWGYDLADGCAAYGGCKFTEVCRSKFQHKILASMPIRVWNPKDPENSPVVRVEDL